MYSGQCMTYCSAIDVWDTLYDIMRCICIDVRDTLYDIMRCICMDVRDTLYDIMRCTLYKHTRACVHVTQLSSISEQVLHACSAKCLTSNEDNFREMGKKVQNLFTYGLHTHPHTHRHTQTHTHTHTTTTTTQECRQRSTSRATGVHTQQHNRANLLRVHCSVPEMCLMPCAVEQE